MKYPRSAFDRTCGLLYFARMTDKIRLHAAGELGPDYHQNLGEGFDGRICRWLRISYADLRDRVLAGATDEELFAWATTTGRAPTEEDILFWNKYASKAGWRDEDIGSTAKLEEFKAASGLTHRTDIVTFFHYYEVDEGREAR